LEEHGYFEIPFLMPPTNDYLEMYRRDAEIRFIQQQLLQRMHEVKFMAVSVRELKD